MRDVHYSSHFSALYKIEWEVDWDSADKIIVTVVSSDRGRVGIVRITTYNLEMK